MQRHQHRIDLTPLALTQNNPEHVPDIEVRLKILFPIAAHMNTIHKSPVLQRPERHRSTAPAVRQSWKRFVSERYWDVRLED
jgi:hypothetical protein